MSELPQFLSKTEARKRVIGIMYQLYRQVPSHRWFLKLALRSRMLMVNFEDYRNLNGRKGLVSGVLDGLNTLMTFNVGTNACLFFWFIMNVGSEPVTIRILSILFVSHLLIALAARDMMNRYVSKAWTDEHTRQLMTGLGTDIYQVMQIDQFDLHLSESVIDGLKRSANDTAKYLNRIIERPNRLFQFFSDESMSLFNTWIRLENNLPTEEQRFRQNWEKYMKGSADPDPENH